MDSQVACALIGKMAELYTNSGTYLSFPLTAIAYSPAQLDSLRNQPVTSDAINQQAQFASLFNLVPGGPLWPPSSPSLLWNLYDQILNSMVLAKSLRTPEEETRYRAALAVLYVQLADGTRTPTPKLLGYQQFRDAWFVTSEKYRNAVLDAQPPSGGGHSSSEVDQLKIELDRVELAWRNEGFKDEVEAALRDEETLGARSSVEQWEQWRTAMDVPGALPSDMSGTRYGPTRIEPADVTTASGWLQFTLDHDQVSAFANAAPAEIRTRLASDQADVDIEKLQFECTSVLLQRPWFEEGALTSGIYRLPPEQPPVSDGRIPGSGVCPAYVRGLILARNFSVKLRENSPKNTAVLGHLAAGRTQMLAGFPLSAPLADKRMLIARLPPGDADDSRARLVRATVLTVPTPAPVMARAVVMRDTVVPATSPSTIKVLSTKKVAPFLRLSGVLTRSAVLGGNVAPPDPPPPPPAPPTPADEVQVVGLICRSIATAPNPDPTLQWS